jgi:hypothetical protein
MTALPMLDPMKWGKAFPYELSTWCLICHTAFTPNNDAVFDAQGNAIYINHESLGVTDTRPVGRSLDTETTSPISTSAKGPSSGAGISHDGSGNAAMGGAGGAGLIAGGAIAAEALLSSPPSN